MREERALLLVQRGNGRHTELCKQGAASIPERKVFLEGKRRELLVKQEELQSALDYIDWKQGFYDDVLSGKAPYTSNLIAVDEKSTD